MQLHFNENDISCGVGLNLLDAEGQTNIDKTFFARVKKVKRRVQLVTFDNKQ